MSTPERLHPMFGSPNQRVADFYEWAYASGVLRIADRTAMEDAMWAEMLRRGLAVYAVTFDETGERWSWVVSEGEVDDSSDDTPCTDLCVDGGARCRVPRRFPVARGGVVHCTAGSWRAPTTQQGRAEYAEECLRELASFAKDRDPYTHAPYEWALRARRQCDQIDSAIPRESAARESAARESVTPLEQAA